MALPEAVQKQAEDVEAMYNELYGKTEDGKTQQAPASQASDTQQAVVQPEGDKKEVEQSPQEQIPSATGELEAMKEEMRRLQAENARLTQSFNVLQGKYNAELPRERQEKEELLRRLEAVESNIGQSTEPKVSAKEKQAFRDDPKWKKIADDYGEDFADTMFETIRQTAQSSAMASIQPIQEQFRSVEQQSMQSRANQYGEAVKTGIPDLAELRDHPLFTKFLNDADPYRGQRYADLLYEAHNALMPGPVVAIYDTFRRDVLQKAKPSGNTPEQATPSHKRDKEAMLTPTNTPTASSGSMETDNTDYITTSFMTQFAKDVSLGKYRNREDEVKKIQARIDKATREGKILQQ